jgi:hypothetical protein
MGGRCPSPPFPHPVLICPLPYQRHAAAGGTAPPPPLAIVPRCCKQPPPLLQRAGPSATSVRLLCYNLWSALLRTFVGSATISGRLCYHLRPALLQSSVGFATSDCWFCYNLPSALLQSLISDRLCYNLQSPSGSATISGRVCYNPPPALLPAAAGAAESFPPLSLTDAGPRWQCYDRRRALLQTVTKLLLAGGGATVRSGTTTGASLHGGERGSGAICGAGVLQAGLNIAGVAPRQICRCCQDGEILSL